MPSPVSLTCSPAQLLTESGRAHRQARLPNKQQIEETVRRRRSSTRTAAFTKAVDSRSKIRNACAPTPDVAGSVDAVPICRHLDMATRPQQRSIAHASASDHIGSGCDPGNADALGPVHRVKRIVEVGLVGGV